MALRMQEGPRGVGSHGGARMPLPAYLRKEKRVSGEAVEAAAKERRVNLEGAREEAA